MIRDKNIEYKYKVDTIEVASFSSMHETDSNGNITPIHTNDIEFTEINAVGQVGLKMEADEISRTALYSPTYIDWENDVFFRAVHANASTNTAHTTTWVVNVDKADAGGHFSHPATGTLDTVIPADANHGSANAIQFTEWGKLDGGTLAPDINDFLSIDVKLGALDGSADTFLMALQIAYLPKLTDGPQVNNQADPTDA